jgi:hypothetical protein
MHSFEDRYYYFCCCDGSLVAGTTGCEKSHLQELIFYTFILHVCSNPVIVMLQTLSPSLFCLIE